MKINRLEWNNIASYGETHVVVEMDDNGKLWQISGNSGSGKSTFLNIGKLLFYGRIDGSDGKPVKVASIANRVNKKGWIRGDISVGSDNYVIERTFSPQGLTITKNGAVIDKAGMKDMQSFIENEIMGGMPYDIYSNVVVLSLSKFKSFISMSPADKRSIIDKIFSMEVINKVYEMVRKDMKELGNSINNGNSQIFSLSQTVEVSKRELENLSNRRSDGELSHILSEIESKISENNARISKADELYVAQNESYSKCNSILLGLQNSETEAVRTCAMYKNEISNVDRQIKLFSEDKCPTCGTSFTGQSFDDLRKSLSDSREKWVSMYNASVDAHMKIKKEKEDAFAALSKIKENMTKITAKRNEISSVITALHTDKAAVLKEMGNTGEAESIMRIINETEASKAEIQNKVNESGDTMRLMGVIENMYSADGIKKRMMENYIPALNQEIRETLERLEFPYELEFDGNFEAHLFSFGEEIDMQTLSYGENKRLNVTVVCAIMKMMKRKYPNINMICLDEVVSSLDYESSCAVIKHLRDVSREMKLNIFIVSHTMLDEDLFDVKVQAEKINGFTALKWLFQE